jgi:hypothetical protein
MEEEEELAEDEVDSVMSGISIVARMTKRIKAAMMTVRGDRWVRGTRTENRKRTDEKSDNQLFPPVHLDELSLASKTVLEVLLGSILLVLDVTESTLELVVIAGRSDGGWPGGLRTEVREETVTGTEEGGRSGRGGLAQFGGGGRLARLAARLALRSVEVDHTLRNWLAGDLVDDLTVEVIVEEAHAVRQFRELGERVWGKKKKVSDAEEAIPGRKGRIRRQREGGKVGAYFGEPRDRRRSCRAK